MADSSSSETNIPVSEWTTGTLKVYHDDKITAVKEIAAAEVKRIDGDIEKLGILLDERAIATEKAMNAALAAAQTAVKEAQIATQEAINKNDAATEKRFQSVNEFRGQLSDQTQTFLPRPEYLAQHKALEDRVTDLTDRLNLSAGKLTGQEVNKADIYKAVGAGIAILGFVLTVVVMIANGFRG